MASDRQFVNGVDAEQLTETIETVSETPEVGQFRFHAETEWTEALRSVTSIAEFDQAGESGLGDRQLERTRLTPSLR